MSKIKKTVILLTLILASFLLIYTKVCKNEDFVNNGEENFKDEIVISVFWPPMLDFVNDTQFKYMKDAHIDLMEYNSDPIFNDPDSVEKMLDLCDKYDIYVTIYDNDAKDWTTLNDEEIQKIAKKWMKYKGVVGFYIKDEPQNANPYGRVTRAIREVFPNAICQMNMFPWGALKDARAHAEDWINSAGYGNVSYLSFDQYPFGVAENSRPDMFYNLDLVRTTGLKYDVKTACYIQSISNMKSYRDPTVSETRYHTSAALAYGIKNIKYFTWITPVERDESFTNAIINPDGTKNARYDGIVDINTKIKAVSGILGRTDAVEIYHSTTQDPSTVKIPDDYFIKPDENCDAIFSLMADKYDEAAIVDAWDKTYNSEGFPEDVDKDGDGIVYCVMTNGEWDYSNAMDKAEYEAWFMSYIGDGKGADIPYMEFTENCIYMANALENPLYRYAVIDDNPAKSREELALNLMEAYRAYSATLPAISERYFDELKIISLTSYDESDSAPATLIGEITEDVLRFDVRYAVNAPNMILAGSWDEGSGEYEGYVTNGVGVHAVRYNGKWYMVGMGNG